jgi:hypothetical protein
MKFRIFGTIFILVVLGAMAVLMQPSDNKGPARPAQSSTSDDVNLPKLNIN